MPTLRTDTSLHHLLILLACVLLLAAGCSRAPSAAPSGSGDILVLAHKGTSDYSIVLDAEATPTERTAAKELQTHLEAVTGVRLPILEGPNPGVADPDRLIVVGPGSRFDAAFPDFDSEALAADGIAMRTRGHTLFLTGGRPRGTLYAVYTFLEDIVGCHWWTATESHIPNRPMLETAPLNMTYTPPLISRGTMYKGTFDGVFASRLKLNGHFHNVPPEYGGHWRIAGWCHTFNQLLPPEEYFAEHPDWYSEINGKRTADRAQLCLTNEAMRAALTAKALEWLRAAPDNRIISISQNDWHGRCECARCSAIEEEEGAPSGLLLRFVNAVAEEIKQEFPDAWVETLAYQYTRQAPRITRPRSNVVVRLCSIESDFSTPLATGERNADFKRDIEAWSAIAPQLFVWDYVANFSNYIIPHPNMRVLAPNIRFFVENKTIGLFEQGDTGCSCGDFVELRAWVIAHLMWNPDLDQRGLTETFLKGYYGAAAQPLARYLAIVHDAVESADIHLKCFMGNTKDWLDLDTLVLATEAFDEAQKAVAGDLILERRVRRARMAVDFVWLKRYRDLRDDAEDRGIPFPGPEDPQALCDAFMQSARDFDIGWKREASPFSVLDESLLREEFYPLAPPPVECQGLEPRQFFQVQGGDFDLANYGEWAEFVDDPAASGGRAVRMPGDHHQWAVQFSFSRGKAKRSPWKCYVVARCDATAQEGEAFNVGIWDMDGQRAIYQRTVRIEEAGGENYVTLELGTHTVPHHGYVWVAPVARPDKVQAVFVDRMFFIREE